MTIPCDVLSKEEVQLAVFAIKPDIVIYAVGLSSLTDANIGGSLSDKLNTLGLFNVAEYGQRFKSKICYISSGYVFGGENKYYLEMDIPDATTVYGKTKASAEFYIQKNSLDYLLFRCSALYGRGINSFSMTSFEILQKKISENKNSACDNYVHTGFLDIYFLAMAIKLCIDNNISNRLMQVSSRDIKTFFEFAQLYCKIFGAPEELISKGRWPFPHVASATSTYTGGDSYYQLDVSNIEGILNISMPTVEESLKFTSKRFNGESIDIKKTQTSNVIKFI